MQARTKKIINEETLEDLQELLWKAASDGELRTVEIVLKSAIDINKSHLGLTPLLVSVKNGHAAVVEVLINAGCDVNQSEFITLESPVFIASAIGRLDILELLIAAKANLNAPNKDELTPLFIAALNGYFSIFNALISAGANFQYVNSIGMTMLQCAHIGKSKAIINKLLELDPTAQDFSQDWLNNQFLKYIQLVDPKKYKLFDINKIRNSTNIGICYGWSLLSLVSYNAGYADLLDKQREAISWWDGTLMTLNHQLNASFMQFARVHWLQGVNLIPGLSHATPEKLLNFIVGDQRIFYTIFKFGFVFNGYEIIPIIHELAKKDKLILIENLKHAVALVKRGINDYIIYDCSAGIKSIEVDTIVNVVIKIRKMLNDGKDLFALGVNIYVLSHCDDDIKEYETIKKNVLTGLIEKRSKNYEINLQDTESKCTALVYAAAINDAETVTQLIHAGAVIDPPKDSLILPLITQNKFFQQFRIKNSLSALWMATQNNCLDVCNQLIIAGADVEYTYKGQTPLYIASALGHIQIVELLIQQKANIVKIDKNKRTALTAASLGGHLAVIKLLFKHAEPAFNNQQMYQALLHAVYNGHLEVVQYLVLMGALLQSEENNINLLEFAVVNGHVNVVRYLSEEYIKNFMIVDLGSYKNLLEIAASFQDEQHELIANYLQEKIEILAAQPKLRISIF